MLLRILIFTAFGILPQAVNTLCAQEKRPVDILNADQVLYDEAIVKADRLVGNVRLRYDGALLNCDSAWRYPNGNFEAFSNVRINRGDSIRIQGDYLLLERDSRILQLRNNIRLDEQATSLTTDYLDYDLSTGIGSYYQGGKITSKVNKNVLTSESGYYNKNTDFFHFRKNVVLTNPEYQVKSDTLSYHNSSEIAYIYGPTVITSKESTIYCQKGWFNTLTEESRFSKGAEVFSGSNILKGDSLIYDGTRAYGEVFGKVFIRDTTSNYYILGDYGWHDDAAQRSLVTGNAEMVQLMGSDSLFLHADTLKALPDSLQRRQVQAYHHVKFFKDDLQGVADSLTYFEADSTLRMFGKPLLWSTVNQISGKSIKLLIYGGELHELYIDEQAQVISEAKEDHYNQISGRSLTGYFRDSELYLLDVIGNGQVVYYPDDGKGGLMGVNRSDCSELTIHIKKNEVERVVMYRKPTGTLFPMSKASREDRFLKNFLWETTNRPLKREDIFEWNESK